MNILISGSNGLVGSALIPELEARGHRVIRLVRGEGYSGDAVSWDPSAGTIDSEALAASRPDGVVHIAGESIASGRWTERKKQAILQSRREGTRLLAKALAALPEPPQVMVSASASGFYGSRGDEILTENSDPGDTFLAEVCREWETAAQPARDAGIRVVHPRLGIVLSAEGGALATTLPIFKLGGGGKIGDGSQFWPWVALDDVVGAIVHALEDDTMRGPANVCSPNPHRNSEYTRILGRVLGRPTVVPLPARAARIALGEMADELLLVSARMKPTHLQNKGYEFRHPQLEGALKHLLGR
ncbi:TIGR01777 family oxidoreductase [Rubrobacter aplysinae]|uniref:TIGR01777 family oxidoreductase n=1 Tax=Rubrobacter aplysinae TaxID=909625 RepID=UPI00064BE1BC|nr:TIGR01777 family oxidoreductase [Rubrobacter aplysinae]